MSVEYLHSPFRHLLKDPATTSQTFRHLLRDLLRETTYLPDPWLRTYWRSYVLSRYRAYLVEPKKTTSFYELLAESEALPGQVKEPRRRKFVKDSARKPDRQLFLLNQARSELRKLARANLGHETPLFSVVCKAYGRSGPRRFQLLSEIWHHEIPEDSEELQALVNAQFGALGVDCKDTLKNRTKDSANKTPEIKEQGVVYGNQDMWNQTSGMTIHPTSSQRKIPFKPKPAVPKLPDKITALIKAQVQAPVPKRYTHITTTPNLPDTNIWGRPLPVNRGRNIIADWLLDLKNTLLPPLPDHEFSRLRKLVKGDLDGMVTPRLPRNMPSLVKIRDYGHPFYQPRRRRVGTIRLDGAKLPKTSFVDGVAMLPSEYIIKATLMDLEHDDLDVWDEADTNSLPINAETVDRNLIATRGAHYLTFSYMRRLYAQVLDLTCRTVHVNGETKFDWGREKPDWRLLWEGVKLRDGKLSERNSRITSGKQSPEMSGPIREASEEGAKPAQEKLASDSWMFREEDDDAELVVLASDQPAKAPS